MLIAVRYASILGAVAVLLVAAGAAQAVSTLPTNGTVTTFQVAGDQLEFDSDESSNYPIVDIPINLYQDPITDPDTELVIGTVYEFVIPNFYDPLPQKTLDISMVGSNSGASELELPRVLDIIGSDAPYESIGPSVPVFGSFVSGSSSPDPAGLLVTEAWEMFPNPDWEIVKIFVPSAFQLQSIEIATQSLPEPGTAALMAAGLFGLGMAGRRRR